MAKAVANKCWRAEEDGHGIRPGRKRLMEVKENHRNEGSEA